MEENEFFRTSTVTGKTYDYFSSIKILNMYQAMAYMDNDVFPVDIKISRNNKTNKRCLVFYFNRNETKEVYDKWCKYELGD